MPALPWSLNSTMSYAKMTVKAGTENISFQSKKSLNSGIHPLETITFQLIHGFITANLKKIKGGTVST